jgi:hypothetical protein
MPGAALAWPVSIISHARRERGRVVVDVRLEQIEPMAHRFLLSFAKDNELRVRDARVAERSQLAELQRDGDTA